MLVFGPSRASLLSPEHLTHPQTFGALKQSSAKQPQTTRPGLPDSNNPIPSTGPHRLPSTCPSGRRMAGVKSWRTAIRARPSPTES